MEGLREMIILFHNHIIILVSPKTTLEVVVDGTLGVTLVTKVDRTINN